MDKSLTSSAEDFTRLVSTCLDPVGNNLSPYGRAVLNHGKTWQLENQLHLGYRLPPVSGLSKQFKLYTLYPAQLELL